MADFYRGPRRRAPATKSGRKAALNAFHELDNHLHAIGRAVQLALDDVALSERHRDNLRQIDDKCSKLVRLVQRLQNLEVLGAEGDVYAVVCMYCSESILIARYIGAAEAATMAEHVRTSHPDRV